MSTFFSVLYYSNSFRHNVFLLSTSIKFIALSKYWYLLSKTLKKSALIIFNSSPILSLTQNPTEIAFVTFTCGLHIDKCSLQLSVFIVCDLSTAFVPAEPFWFSLVWFGLLVAPFATLCCFCLIFLPYRH